MDNPEARQSLSPEDIFLVWPLGLPTPTGPIWEQMEPEWAGSHGAWTREGMAGYELTGAMLWM